MTDAPKRIWLSAVDEEGEVSVWFDPDEGGTEYLRADIAADLLAAARRILNTFPPVEGKGAAGSGYTSYDLADVDALRAAIAKATP